MTKPARPPIAVSTTASIKNCESILSLVAPTALRTPISFVRSVTETSMMFITPMPPIISATNEIAVSTR